VVLLRPAADGPELTGEYEQVVPDWGWSVRFRYRVIRVWELPPERLLAAGLPVLPLAPVSRVPPERLPEVLRAVAERLRDEAGPELKATLWAATEILLGLYHPSERVRELTKEVTAMILGIRGIEESSVYQDIFAKGRAEGKAEGEAKGRAEGEAKGRAEGEVEEARKILLGLGRKKLGPPDERVLARVAGLNDLDRLNLLLERILDVASWAELLAAADS
jgi:predicted transposase YdaD